MCFSLILCKCLMLAALIGSTAFTQVFCFDFNFPNFPDQNRNELLHNKSTVALNAIQVTYDYRGDIANQSGRVFYKDQFRLWRDNKKVKAAFNSTFVLNILNQTIPGGEGLAFILTGVTDLPESSDGEWLGIVNASSNGTSQPQIVAVEFDTRKSFPEDIDDNHVGLDINSVYSIRQVPLESIILSNGTDYRVNVQYDGKNMTVFVEDMENPLFSEPIDLSTYLPEKVFVGFSASTGNLTQKNCVKSWEFLGEDIGEDSKLFQVLIIVLVLVLVMLIIGISFYYLYWRRKYKTWEVENLSIEEQIHGSNLAPRKFRLRELKKVTGNFNPKNKLGKGGFGTVYKGTWRNKEIAVKRVSETSRQGKQEFIAEVTTIGSLRHRNLVKLIGWCYESPGSGLICITGVRKEFFIATSKQATSCLISSSKRGWGISDWPRTIQERATVETDVYAFGVLILEVACGRKPGNQTDQNNYNNSIVHWLWELHRKGKILDGADSRLDGEFSEKEMECVLILGLACCHPNPHLRPSMKTVLQVLSGETEPPEVPLERPSFVWPAMPPSFSDLDYSLAGSQLAPFSELAGR
ncbi:Lectin receptor kinase [Melia azedarach]|uniref:Lectin receptor kinase n=1 Tax=Melia azedarach TaxID=155640 RepID=A0ACC1X2M1_MELAZ|nr:Lectin receptor kinase [Melia azedarach]